MRVVSVTDGDTFRVLTPGGEQQKIRLAEVDCPEHDQPYGDSAKRELSDLVSRKYVQIDALKLDVHGRTVARVRAGALDVSAELIRRGACWVYPEYRRDPHWKALEKEAREAKRGLWALPKSQQIPPWKWKHGGRQQDTTSDFTCGAKTRCAEMSSCAEARFYLERCGATKIDGDGNGIPCEALCR